MTNISHRVKIEETKLLSDNHYILNRVSFAWQRSDGAWTKDNKREVYDRGDGCAILLFNREKRSVILVKQFRLPAYMNGYRDMLIEAAAGLLDEADPLSRIISEAEEETGYRPKNARKIFECFMSPGSVTETLTLFVGEYDAASRSGEGGGLEDEGEDIEVLELRF